MGGPDLSSPREPLNRSWPRPGNPRPARWRRVSLRLVGQYHPACPSTDSCQALGETMPTVIGYHEVKDTQHWLASSKREEFWSARRHQHPDIRRPVGGPPAATSRSSARAATAPSFAPVSTR